MGNQTDYWLEQFLNYCRGDEQAALLILEELQNIAEWVGCTRFGLSREQAKIDKQDIAMDALIRLTRYYGGRKKDDFRVAGGKSHFGRLMEKTVGSLFLNQPRFRKRGYFCITQPILDYLQVCSLPDYLITGLRTHLNQVFKTKKKFNVIITPLFASKQDEALYLPLILEHVSHYRHPPISRRASLDDVESIPELQQQFGAEISDHGGWERFNRAFHTCMETLKEKSVKLWLAWSIWLYISDIDLAKWGGLIGRYIPFEKLDEAASEYHKILQTLQWIGRNCPSELKLPVEICRELAMGIKESTAKSDKRRARDFIEKCLQSKGFSLETI